MSQEFDFVVGSIKKLSRVNRLESLERSEILSMKGTKRGFLKNEEIEIKIKRQNGNQSMLDVTASVDGLTKSISIEKKQCEEIFKSYEMLDAKLQLKLDAMFKGQEANYMEAVTEVLQNINKICLKLKSEQDYFYRSEKDQILISEISDNPTNTMICIKKSTVGNPKKIFVISKLSSKERIGEIEKEYILDTIRDTMLLDNERFIKMLIYLNENNGRVDDFSDFAIHAFCDQINNIYPKLKPNIKVSVRGQNNSELVFSLKRGLNDPDFLEFFRNGIMLKAAIKNCRNFRIAKLVFHDQVDNSSDSYTIDEMERMDLH